MGALAGAWLVFPVLLALVASGWGLLVEQVAGARLPGALLPGLGLAALAVALSVTSRTVPGLGVPVVIAGAVAGLGLCTARVGPRPGVGTLRPRAVTAVVAGGAFVLYGAPVLLSGHPAVSGFIRLDDTTTFLALGDWAFGHGRSTAGLAPSTYEAVLQINLGTGYPVGSILPLVGVGRLTGIDLVWLWAPYLSALAAILALAIAEICRPLAPDARVRAAVAVLASGAALLVGYAWWGGIKEMWAAALAAVAAALVPWTAEAIAGRRTAGAARRLVPLAVITGGLVTALSVAGVVWVAPAVAALVAAAAVRRGRGRVVPAIIAGTVVAGLALLPLMRLIPFVKSVTGSGPTGPDRLGNLLRPLSPAQVLGIWPAEDFRVAASAPALTSILLAVVVAAALWSVWRAARLQAYGVLALAGVLAAGLAIVLVSSWPWAEAKALAIASPVPLALAGAGAADLLATRRRRIVGGIALAALTVGVLWSAALAFHGTTLTPYDRHRELQAIGERFAGRGPALMTEFDPYGSRWLLRRLDIEGASELRRRTVPLAAGGMLQKGESADIDAFALGALDPYRLLVLRRSPAASRPPAAFRRVWRGRFYDVWQRTPGRAVVAHLALGTPISPSAVPRCADVRRLATQAGPGGALLAAVTPQPAVAGLDTARAPKGWLVTGPSTLAPAGDGTAHATIDLARPGRFDVWLGGAFRGAVTVFVDGVRVGGRRHELSYTGQWVPFGTADLTAGPHAISVRSSDGPLLPGTGGLDRFSIGPVALAPATGARPVIEVPAAQAGRLCGRPLDWIEAVR